MKIFKVDHTVKYGGDVLRKSVQRAAVSVLPKPVTMQTFMSTRCNALIKRKDARAINNQRLRAMLNKKVAGFLL
jgi:hypothetical protein